jgi:hypothetical protein
MSPVGFEPAVSEGERPQTYDLDRAATGTGIIINHLKFEINLELISMPLKFAILIFAWVHAVAQIVEALRYKSEGYGFDSRWCHWNFSLT